MLRHPELLAEVGGGSDAFRQTNAWPYMGNKVFFGYLIDSGP